MRDSTPIDSILSLLPAVLSIGLLLPVAAIAQEADTNQAAREIGAAAADDEGFVVPEGTAAELFEFIDRVKDAEPTSSGVFTREDALNYLGLKLEAVFAACERIMEAEPDEATELKVIRERLMAYSALGHIDPDASEEGIVSFTRELAADKRPAIVKLVAMLELDAKASVAEKMPPATRAEMIEEFFALIDSHGVDRRMYDMLTDIGQIVEKKDGSEAAAQLSDRLATAMEKSDDEELRDRAAKLHGQARRMRLPGNFMDVFGTTAAGEEFDWSAYRGKVVLVDFWASWCGPCRREIPNMKSQLERYGEKGFDIVGINLDTVVEDYQDYVDTMELTWTNLMSSNEDEQGWDNPLAVQYGVDAIPRAILVDQQGNVVSMLARGPGLDRLLAELLGPVETDEAGSIGQE